MSILLKRLVLRNVASYGTKNNEVDFGSLGYPVYVSGPNGAGKTTFFVDGLSFALFGSAYGTTRRAGRLFIRAGRKVAGEVLLELFHDDKLISIRRWYDGKGWRVEIRGSEGGRLKLITNSASEAHRYVEELIGLDYDGFINSVVVRQGDVYSFLDAKPAERREIILNLLNINLQRVRDRLSTMIKTESERLRIIDEQLQRLEGQLEYESEDDIKAELEEVEREISECSHKIEELDKLIESLDMEIGDVSSQIGSYMGKFEQLNNLRSQISEYINRLAIPEDLVDEEKIRDIIERLESLSRVMDDLSKLSSEFDRLSKIMEKISILDEYMSRASELGKKRDSIISQALDTVGLEPSRDSIEGVIRRIGELEGRLSEVKDKIVLLRDPKISECPLCGQPISPGHRNALLARLTKEADVIQDEISRLQSIRDSLQAFMGELDELDQELQRINGSINTLKLELADVDRGMVDRQLKEIDRMRVELESRRDGFYRDFEETGIARDAVERLLKNIGYLHKLMSSIETVYRLGNELSMVDIEGLRSRLDELDNKRRKARDDRGELSKRISELQLKREGLLRQMDLLKNYMELRDKAGELRGRLRILRLLDEYVFKESRFPRFLMRSVVEGVLEGMVNNVLRTIFPNAYVRLKVPPDARGVEVDVYIDNVRRDVATLSGGEKTLIGFAIRLAIGSLLSGMRGGTSVGFLIVDEGFGALDDENRDLVANAIGNLVDSGLYRQVIVISHEADLMNHPVFKSYIYVSKADGVSNIKIS